MKRLLRAWRANARGGIILNDRTYAGVFAMIFSILVLLTASGYAHEDHDEQSLRSVETEELSQTECPVMVGNEVDRKMFVDYEGKRVYFCCNSCRSAFTKEPEKYLHRLPQFASAELAHNGHNHDTHQHVAFESILAQLIVPMGITTLSLVAITVFLSVFRRLNLRLMLKWHKRFGFVSLISGAIHAILVLVAH